MYPASIDTQIIDSTHIKAHRSAAGGKDVGDYPSACCNPDDRFGDRRIRSVNRSSDDKRRRYLKERASDLHTLSENPSIRDYFENRFYGLVEDAEIYRQEIDSTNCTQTGSARWDRPGARPRHPIKRHHQLI
jgi:hypothetical protein